MPTEIYRYKKKRTLTGNRDLCGRNYKKQKKYEKETFTQS